MLHRLSLSILIVIVVFAMSLSAIAQGETVTIWFTGDEQQGAALQSAADVWAEETGNTVQVEVVSWSDAYAQALAAVNAQEGGDILMGGMSWGISLGTIGGMVNLGETFGDDVANIAEISNPGFYSAIVTPDGTVYGIPYNLDTYLMYYRPDALAEKGIDAPPATWDDLVAALDAGANAGIGWGNASWLSFQNFLYQAGGTWYNEDCSAAAINSEEGLTALEFYTTLYEDYGFPAEEVGTAAAFSTGEMDIVIDGEWTASGINSSYPELEGTWSVAPLPAGPSGNYTAFIGGKMMGLFSFSDTPDAAWDLMLFLSTEEAAQLQTEAYFDVQQIFVPPQPENAQYIQGGDDINAALSSQLMDAAGPPNCPGWEETNADVNLVLQSVLFEGTPFEDALVDMEDIMNQGIADYSM